MKIIFMGTPDFSVPTLKALLESNHEVVACYTQPDKPKGRDNKVRKTPVKEVCEQYNIPVYQPKRIRSKEEVEQFLAIEADIAIVIAYGQILPKVILESPRWGCVNIHASLLPKYRGAAPYQWAVINGEIKSGITIMQMNIGMDTGDMLVKEEINLAPDETAGSLHDKLMVMGGPLILKTLELIADNELKPEVQDNQKATLAPMLSKDVGEIDWQKEAGEIERLVRGLNPWPSAFTYLGEHMLKLYKVTVVLLKDFEKSEASEAEENLSLWENGSICRVLPKEGFIVKCGENGLLVKEVQLQGKRRMDAASFMRGYVLSTGTVLGKKTDSLEFGFGGRKND